MNKIMFFMAVLTLCTVLNAEEQRLMTILFSNDTHGMAWAFDESDNPGVGGLAAAKTLVDKIREEVQLNNGEVTLVSSGNITMGDPRSNICENIPLIKGMALIGYDAMTVGNHEFDFGVKIFKKMQKEAGFPFISANLQEGGKPMVKEYIEKKLLNGLTVAFIGLTTPETAKITTAGLRNEIKISDPIERANKLAAELKKRNDIVVLLSNLGYYETDNSYDGFPGDVALAKNVKNIDLIIGGHTKKQFDKPIEVNGIPIVQTEGLGKWFGRFDFYFEGKKITQKNYKVYPVNVKKKVGKTYENIGTTIKENAAMLDMLKGFNCEFSMQTLGETEIEFPGKKEMLRDKESVLADVITDIVRGRTATDIAFINGGGIRQGLAKGYITEKDVYSVFPFNDTIVVGEISGAELMNVLNFFAEKKMGTGGFLHFSGMTVVVNQGKIEDVKIGGKPVDQGKKYTFTINSFLASGGDGYTMLRDLKEKKFTGFSVPAVLVEFIKMEKILSKPKTGRMTVK